MKASHKPGYCAAAKNKMMISLDLICGFGGTTQKNEEMVARTKKFHRFRASHLDNLQMHSKKEPVIYDDVGIKQRRTLNEIRMLEVKAVAGIATTCSLTAIVSCLVVLAGLFQEIDDIEIQVRERESQLLHQFPSLSRSMSLSVCSNLKRTQRGTT